MRNVGESESLWVQLCMIPSGATLAREPWPEQGSLTHVQVETVEFGNAVLCDELGDGWVPLTHPSEEFGNTHGCGGNVSVKVSGVKMNEMRMIASRYST